MSTFKNIPYLHSFTACIFFFIMTMAVVVELPYNNARYWGSLLVLLVTLSYYLVIFIGIENYFLNWMSLFLLIVMLFLILYGVINADVQGSIHIFSNVFLFTAGIIWGYEHYDNDVFFR